MSSLKSRRGARTGPITTRRHGGNPTGAQKLAGKEPQGLFVDFTDQSVLIRSASDATDLRNTVGRTDGNGNLRGPSSIFTYTSPSVKMVTNLSGLLEFAPHNLHQNSNNWSSLNGGASASVAVTTDNVVAPDGTLTADRIVFSGSNGHIYHRLSSPAPIVGMSYVFSVWLRADSTVSVRQRGYTNAFSDVQATTHTVTTTWQRFEIATIVAAGSTYLEVGFDDRASAGGPATNPTFYAWGAVVRRTPSPLFEISTSGSAVYALPIDHNPSTREPLGLLVEDTRTNLCLWSDDMTNAAWTKTNMTTAKTATGPDGVANSATTLTATAGNATVLQSITSGAATRITSCYIKRRTGTGTIELTHNNGTNWGAVTVTSDWTRVSLGNSSFANPVVGIRIVTSGDEVDVALFQHELNANISSPIKTTSATVTRAADNITLAVSAFPSLSPAATIIEEHILIGLASTTFNTVFEVQASSRSNTTGIVRHGSISTLQMLALGSGFSDQATLTLSSGAALNTSYRTASRFNTNNFGSSLNGGAALTDVSGTWPVSALVTLFLGHTGSGSDAVCGYIRHFVAVPVAKSDTELISASSRR